MPEELKEKKRNNRGVVVPEHLAKPYDPENIHLTKAQFIEKQRARKEKELKIAEFAAGLDKEKETETSTPEKPAEAKPRGRPKKIE